jgi:cytochrome-b5 reductase
MSESAFSRKYIDGIYVPVVLLIVGTFIVKREYTIYAAALGLAFGTLKFFNLRTRSSSVLSAACLLAIDPH